MKPHITGDSSLYHTNLHHTNRPVLIVCLPPSWGAMKQAELMSHAVGILQATVLLSGKGSYVCIDVCQCARCPLKAVCQQGRQVDSHTCDKVHHRVFLFLHHWNSWLVGEVLGRGASEAVKRRLARRQENTLPTRILTGQRRESNGHKSQRREEDDVWREENRLRLFQSRSNLSRRTGMCEEAEAVRG